MSASLMVQLAGVDTEVRRGERLVLDSQGTTQPIQVAANHDDDDSDSQKAAMAATSDYGATYLGMTTAGWTAVGIVAAAVGGAVTINALSDDDGIGS